MIASVRDAETGQRGFLLTGKSEYLKPYEAALRAIDVNFVSLQPSPRIRPDQRQGAAQLKRLVEYKISELKETITLSRSTGLAAALAVVRSDRGLRSMESIRAVSEALRQDETARLLNLTESIQALARSSQARGLVGTALLATLLVGAIVMIMRTTAQRERLISDLDLSNRSIDRVRELLQTTIYSIGDAVIATDEIGRVTLMNPVAEKLTGWREDEARGQSVDRVFHIVNEQPRFLVENPVHRVLETGSIVGLANHAILVSKRGADIPIDDSGAPIRAKDRSIHGVVLVFRDITDRNHAEARLRESEERFRTMADSAPVLIWTAGKDRLFDYFNKTWLDFTGCSLTDELGDGSTKRVHPDDRNHVTQSYTAAFEARQPFSIEYRLRRHDGKSCWVLNTGVPRVNSAGEFSGYIGSCIDIDDRKRHETDLLESAKLESVGVLAGGIAHDFNNLLVGILGNASLLEDYVAKTLKAEVSCQP